MLHRVAQRFQPRMIRRQFRKLGGIHDRSMKRRDKLLECRNPGRIVRAARPIAPCGKRPANLPDRIRLVRQIMGQIGGQRPSPDQARHRGRQSRRRFPPTIRSPTECSAFPFRSTATHPASRARPSSRRSPDPSSRRSAFLRLIATRWTATISSSSATISGGFSTPVSFASSVPPTFGRTTGHSMMYAHIASNR